MSTSDDTQKDDVSEKRKQLSMLQDLLSRVYVSSDIQAVMQNIADSLEAILPNASISFLISSIEGREYMQQIFVTSTISVGITYQSIIMREINAYVSSLPDAISNKEALKLQLAKKIYFRFSHGLCEVDR